MMTAERSIRSWGPSAAAALGGVVVGAFVGALVTFTLLSATDRRDDPAPDREAEIHAMGHEVMPFSLDLTTHVFEMTTSGGVQEVLADDPADADQVGLIRQHLEHEAMRFRSGDFSDPSALHGAEMPGLRTLSAAAGRMEVDYEDVPAGGRIIFSSQDGDVITAVHRWFGAQLSDHGADATYR